MENASKALIIAGAVLITILIIGLGVFLYRQTAETVKNPGLDQLVVQQFNEKFEPYEGIKTGYEVKQVIMTALESDVYNYSEDDSLLVTVNGVLPVDITEIDGEEIKLMDNYNISMERNSKNGLIYNIVITKEPTD